MYTENCLFTNNEAGYTGGMLFLVLSHYMDVGSTFINTYAVEEAGALYAIK